MVPAHLEDFLISQVREVRHSGRPFYAHLKGTYDLLQAKGLPEYVCRAGLFHSIYGTRHFKHQALSFNQRWLVIRLIGVKAERLAYIFCVTDRPKALVVATGQHVSVVHDRYQDRPIALSKDDLRDLLEIEAANLAEQGGGAMLQPVLDSLALMGIDRA